MMQIFGKGLSGILIALLLIPFVLTACSSTVKQDENYLSELFERIPEEDLLQDADATNEPEITEYKTEAERILFVGDSRTIDMFADSDDEITGMEIDGIVVYARHGHGFKYLKKVVNKYGHENFDVLVTWMGANDGGDFSSYNRFYDTLLSEGKKLIVCTIGPTNDSGLEADDHPAYENEKMISFNEKLTEWAEKNKVQVIDLYSYIVKNIEIDPKDGIHYTPRPTTDIWSHIIESLP